MKSACPMHQPTVVLQTVQQRNAALTGAGAPVESVQRMRCARTVSANVYQTAPARSAGKTGAELYAGLVPMAITAMMASVWRESAYRIARARNVETADARASLTRAGNALIAKCASKGSVSAMNRASQIALVWNAEMTVAEEAVESAPKPSRSAWLAAARVIASRHVMARNAGTMGAVGIAECVLPLPPIALKANVRWMQRVFPTVSATSAAMTGAVGAVGIVRRPPPCVLRTLVNQQTTLLRVKGLATRVAVPWPVLGSLAQHGD